MEKIPSFTINHLKLLPGVYVSRRDVSGDTHVTTFDIRMTRPNREPALTPRALHAMEHSRNPHHRTSGGNFFAEP